LVHQTSEWNDEFNVDISEKIKYGENNLLAISIYNEYRKDNMFFGGIRGYIQIESNDYMAKEFISDEDIKTGKHIKQTARDKQILTFGEMICDDGRIDDNYLPRKIEDVDAYLTDVNKAVEVILLECRYSDPMILEKYYPSILANKGKENDSIYGWYMKNTSTAFKDKFVPYSEFDKYPNESNPVLSRIQNTIDIVHKKGLKVYFSFGLEGPDLSLPVTLVNCSLPGAQVYDFKIHPEYQSQVFNPKTGEFITLENFLDSTNEEAVEYCMRNVENTLKKIKDIDYYNIVHEHDFGFFRGRRNGWNNSIYINDKSDVIKKYKDK
jgi:hypothetical protein